MVFSSLTFLQCFLPLCLLAYFVAPKAWRNGILFAFSLLFYAWGEPVYVLLMIFSTVLDYTCGQLAERYRGQRRAKAALLVSVCVNLGLLGVFKYSDFLICTVNSLFGTAMPQPNLPLPIGISFYTFQTMSYTIDVYRGEAKAQKNIINFGAYVTLFPQLIAGPIVRYQTVADELEHRECTVELFSSGIKRFVCGIGKKVLLANNIGLLWEAASAQTTPTVLTAWLGVIAYGFQIYFDFSGYSDMAIGLGKMMGFHFPENFNYPYLSKSISEFWRRWHITLGSWFKSYVYFPLGGNRKGMPRTIMNLAITWFLTGVWHGASWNFILWGSLYGIVIILEKLFLGKWLQKIPAVFCHIYTMLLVILGWVLFDTADLPTAAAYIANMFGAGGTPFIDSTAMYQIATYGITFIICIIGCTDLPKLGVEFIKKKIPPIINYGGIVAIMGMFVMCAAYLVDQTYNPFLYFNF